VDTCGHVQWDTIESVLPYVSFFLWDVKLMDDRKHKQITGASNRSILNNLRMTSERGAPVYIRIPVIPGYNDSEDNLIATCEFARGLPSLVEIDLLPLHHLGEARYAGLGRRYPIEGTPLIPDSTMRHMKSLVESRGLLCNIIG
jgi:pyruvate formate lyase activating enzyme